MAGAAGPRRLRALTSSLLSFALPSLCCLQSLEPDEDPLCMLLLIDHLALRARNYEYLIRLFQEWEVSVHLQCDWQPG